MMNLVSSSVPQRAAPHSKEAFSGECRQAPACLNAILFKRVMACCLLLCLATVTCLKAQQLEGLRPHIQQIVSVVDHIEVTAFVPEGYQQVFLEGKPRFGQGAWVPKAVLYTNGQAGIFRFELKPSRDNEWLRIKAVRLDDLDASAFTGPHEFVAPQEEEGITANAIPTLDGAAGAEMEDASKTSETSERSVVESDIWSIHEDRLFFFNQFRGLQVVDISDVKQPQLSGELSLPAAGEQMYVMDAAYAVLLARNRCNYWSGDAESRLVMIDVTKQQPVIASSVPVQGTIQESRLVGTALYVVSQIYQYREDLLGERVWEWGSLVSSYDLSDPSQPIARDSIWIPGYGNVVHATSEMLFVCTQGEGQNDWWQSRIRMIDIGASDGSMEEVAIIQPRGRVKDKFKLSVHEEVLRVISESREPELMTRLETYDLSVPAKPTRLGQVELGKNESLFATRFDGDKAYIVTFLRVDPLWIVDLSDPSRPTISGELEVPGWSTYIQPLGDRLLSIGIDNVEGWRVAVSLFDVRDPSQPGLLSRVPIGTHHSWSEANTDEKAFGWLEEAGLILVPFQAYEENQTTMAVQLIDLQGDQLVKRGLIEHEVRPRRSTMVDEAILSLSGRSLLSVGVEDRDHPRVQSELELSWKVDQLFAFEEYHIELNRGSLWSPTSSSIRVVSVANDTAALSRIPLGEDYVLGAELRGQLFYTLQASGGPSHLVQVEDSEETREQKLHLKVFDLSEMPAVSLVHESVTPLETTLPMSDLKALWVREDLLVWQTSQGNYYGWWGVPFMDVVGDALWPWPGNWGGARFLAYRAPGDGKATFLSDFDMALDSVWDFSEAYTAEGLVYLSYQTMLSGENVSLKRPGIPWVRKSYLSVIDYEDPIHPTLRDPVSLPGQLKGLSHQGKVVYTVGQHYDADTFQSDGKDWLDVLAYDGIAARLSDSRHFSDQWPHLVQVDGEGRIIAHQLDVSPENDLKDAPDISNISQWTVSSRGLLEPVGKPWFLPFSSYEMEWSHDDLLLRMGQDVWHFGLAEQGGLNLLGAYTPSGCYGFSLDGSLLGEEGLLWAPGGDYGALALTQHDAEQPVVRFATGVRFDDCESYCEESLYIERTYTTFVASTSMNTLPPYQERSWDATLWSRCESLLDWESFQALPADVSCADCEGTGTEWIEISLAGATHRVTFPQGARLEGAEALQDLLQRLRGSFKVPPPELESLRYFEHTSGMDGLSRKDVTINPSNTYWHFSDPSGASKPRSGSRRTQARDWQSLTEIVRWPAILEAALPWENRCWDCEGFGWLELSVHHQPYQIPLDAPGIQDLLVEVLSQVSLFEPPAPPTKISRVVYTEDLGRCVGYCVKQQQWDGETLVLTARSPDTSFPAIDIKQEVPEDVWQLLTELLSSQPWDDWGSEIGCPGCTDRGKGILQVWEGDAVHEVSFDLPSPPDTLAEVMDILSQWGEIADWGVDDASASE